MSWKAGPERPRTPFCWHCGRRFQGRAFATVKDPLDFSHDVHKACAAELVNDYGDGVVTFLSGTVAKPAKVLP